MKFNRYHLYCVLLGLVLFFSGCATTQERLLDSDSSQVQLRSIQSRTFDNIDKETTLRTIMATLQDLGFVIDQADSMLGTVTATKLNKYALRLTVSIRPKGESQTLIRANCQYQDRPVYDPEPYQSFFTSLEKAMFLTTHTEGGGAGRDVEQTTKGLSSVQKDTASAIEPKQSPPLVQSAPMISLDSEYKKGEMVLIEFIDGSSKIITITNIDEKFIAGNYDYQGGSYQVSDVWSRSNIVSMKRVRATKETRISEPAKTKPEDIFKNGDVIILEFKDGSTKEIILTHMNDRLIAGHYKYDRGHTTPVNYDRRDVRRISYAKKDPNKTY
jgi:hypothetical protein